MTTEQLLAAVYHRYRQCLNERRWNDPREFFHEELSYNSTPMSLGDYRATRQAETSAIPDLHFTPDLIVTDADTLACRLFFRCTPQQPFLGFEPTGTPISFAEHVFYRFRDQKIVQVWSLIDTSAIAAQAAEQGGH